MKRNGTVMAIFQVEKADLKDGSLSLDVLDWDFTCYRKIGNIQVSETNHTYHAIVVLFCNRSFTSEHCVVTFELLHLTMKKVGLDDTGGATSLPLKLEPDLPCS